MRIVLVNWAKIRDGASSGGGVNGYCQNLALELARRGHEVISLCGGTTFEPATPGSERPGPCHIRRLEDWVPAAAQPVRVYEVINSPVLAPSIAQFRDPMGEIAAPELESQIESWAAEIRPDIVHFHNIEGFSAGCIPALRRAHPAASILYSLHNYHTLCPQVYLMQGHRRPCFDYQGGHACRTCIPTVDPDHERLRAIAKLRGEAIPPEWSVWGVPTESGREEQKPGRGLFRWLRRSGEIRPAEPLIEEQPWTEPWIRRPARRPLLNVIQPDSDQGRELAPWGHRRHAMVAMLNSCDRVLAVSDFVARKFESMGVNPGKLKTLHIGSRMTEIAADYRRAHLHSPRREQLPIRICFLGYNNYYKGLPMLAESLELLTPEYLRHLHLHVHALAGEQMEPALRALEPRLAGLTLRHGYTYEEIPALLDQIDLGLVTSVWWDNAPQTVMEFLACGIPVLAANLGGIPDFIRDGENGLLFRGNDRWDLARRLAEIIQKAAIIPKFRAGVRPPKSMHEHATEIERLYAGPLS